MDEFVTRHHTVNKRDDTPGVGSHIGLVRHHEHRNTLVAVQFDEQFHNFVAAFAVEVACWFIGKQNIRTRDDGSSNGNTLLLAA